MRVGLALLVGIALAGSAHAAQLPSTGDLLDRYARGDFSAFTPPRTADDLGRFRQALQRDADAWLRRSDGKSLRKRQLIAATIALEAARLSLDLDWGEGRRLVEWGSELLTKAPPDEPERLWHLAALSLVQGAGDAEVLVKQQKTAWPRFQNEARFLLGLVIMLEGQTWPEPDRAKPWEEDETALQQAHELVTARGRSRQGAGEEERAKAAEYERRNRMRSTISLLEDLSNADEIRAEVLLRLGFLHLRLQRPEIATEQFEEVVTITDDPYLLYLAQLFTGMSREQMGDRANATEAYRAALAAMPLAQAASTALAALLFLGGDVAEAARVADEAIAAGAEDPWRTYHLGEFRFWGERIAAVHEVLR